MPRQSRLYDACARAHRERTSRRPDACCSFRIGPPTQGPVTLLRRCASRLGNHAEADEADAVPFCLPVAPIWDDSRCTLRSARPQKLRAPSMASSDPRRIHALQPPASRRCAAAPPSPRATRSAAGAKAGADPGSPPNKGCEPSPCARVRRWRALATGQGLVSPLLPSKPSKAKQERGRPPISSPPDVAHAQPPKSLSKDTGVATLVELCGTPGPRSQRLRPGPPPTRAASTR